MDIHVKQVHIINSAQVDIWRRRACWLVKRATHTQATMAVGGGAGFLRFFTQGHQAICTFCNNQETLEMLTTTPILTMITEVDVGVPRGGQELGLNWAAHAHFLLVAAGFRICVAGVVFF